MKILHKESTRRVREDFQETFNYGVFRISRVSKIRRKRIECEEGKINILKNKGTKTFKFQDILILEEK
jgi:hypothetical protein